MKELVEIQPLQQGLAELIAYLQLADETFSAVVDEETTEIIFWRGRGRDGLDHPRQARLPRVIFVR